MWLHHQDFNKLNDHAACSFEQIQEAASHKEPQYVYLPPPSHKPSK